MADFPFDKLLAPLSPEEPCGPDLELTGDPSYMNFTARVEGLLPEAFFNFDRRSVDFVAETATITALSAKTRDLRLLVPLAKLMILNLDFAGFEQAFTAIVALVNERWEHVHPQPLDGDPIMRIIALQTLDDMPNTVLPLQSATLFKTRRFGPVSYRAHQLADGKIAGRVSVEDDGNNEKVPTPNDLRVAVTEVEMAELVSARDCAGRLFAAVGALEASVDEKSGQIGALRFPQLKPMADGIYRFLDASVVLRDPSQGSAPAAPDDDTDGGPLPGESAAPAGAIKSVDAAREALAAAAGYFAGKEPSSPIRLLLAQAQALVGKTFFEALQSLAPEFAGQAAIKLGSELPLSLPVERLAALLSPDAEAPPAEPEAEPEIVEEAAETAEAEPAAEAPAEDADAPAKLPVDASAESEAEPLAPAIDTPPAIKVASAKTRTQAMQLLDQVSGFYRLNEPSSPIPFLLDQARSSAGRDFVGLVRDVLPANALRVDE